MHCSFKFKSNEKENIMININDAFESLENETEYTGQCIILETKDGWAKCQTISSGKIWANSLKDLKSRVITHEDGSFSFETKEQKNPFGL